LWASLNCSVIFSAQPTTMGTCLYDNASKQMVILRCIGPEAFFLAKVVFPF
jgi:hypothetical protein